MHTSPTVYLYTAVNTFAAPTISTNMLIYIDATISFLHISDLLDLHNADPLKLHNAVPNPTYNIAVIYRHITAAHQTPADILQGAINEPAQEHNDTSVSMYILTNSQLENIDPNRHDFSTYFTNPFLTNLNEPLYNIFDYLLNINPCYHCSNFPCTHHRYLHPLGRYILSNTHSTQT